MNKSTKLEFILLLLLIKRYQLFKDGINISLNEILLFLNKLYFKNNKFNKKELIHFVKEDNNKDIVDFLWTEAIINPEI